MSSAEEGCIKAKVDAIPREELIGLVLKGKERQQELVTLCKKTQEEKEALKGALRKARDQIINLQSKHEAAIAATSKGCDQSPLV